MSNPLAATAEAAQTAVADASRIVLVGAVDSGIVRTNTGLSGSVIGNWLADNVIFVLVLLIAVSIFVAAMTKKVRDAFIAFGISLLAFGVVFIAFNWRSVMNWIGQTFFS